MNTTTKKTTAYDVLIAGAGPVGLMLACELALAKCSVLIVEKEAESQSILKQVPFGIRGLNALSVAALYRRGLLDELQLHKRLKNPHQNAGQGANRQVGHFAGIPFREGNIDISQWKWRIPSDTDTSLISEMEELETVLTRRAEALGVIVMRGLGITGFQQTEHTVIIAAGDQTFKANWLVGCDGARSVVRKASGFDFAGTEPHFTGYTARVELANDEQLKPGRNVTPRGMYLQSQPGYIQLQDFDDGAFHASGTQVTQERVQEVLRRISGTDVTVTTLHIGTTWTDRARQATSYCNGRVLLAGDAAHIHSPLGGQGLNLGLGDAVNLGWKLAATIKGHAPEGLLDTYDAERQPVGTQVLDWSRAQVVIMQPGAAGQALNAIFRDLIATRDGATYFAGRVWGINTRYELGGEHPLTGYSVPNFELEDGTRIGTLMHDGKGILLDFTRDNALKELAGEYNKQMKYITGIAKEQLGLSAVLVRPDGIIAWAGTGAADAVAVRQAIARWFGS